MARIRSIKPEFFTSADITALSPLARLLYIGTWLEADREGRLRWNVDTLKRRYLPEDVCDAHGVASELTRTGLVVLYGDGLACVPKFAEHQVINPKEQRSKLPAPTEQEMHASRTRQGRVSDAPSLPSFPSPSIPIRSGNLIMGPAEYAKRLEFCAFVGSRLEVPRTLHRELMNLLGGAEPESQLQAWYESVNTEIEGTGESIKPSVYKWLKARYEAWQGNGSSSINAQIDRWATS